MGIGGEESQDTGADCSWIPQSPDAPVQSKPHLIHHDVQRNLNPVIWSESEGCLVACLPTSNDSSIGVTAGQDSFPHDHVQPFQFTADNTADLWNHISFGSLLYLANEASGKFLGTPTPWNHGFQFPASQRNNAAYTPGSQLRNASVCSDSNTPHFEPVTPEKSMGTGRRQITNTQHSCTGEWENEEKHVEELGVACGGPTVVVIKSGKEIQRETTGTSLDAASSLADYPSMDDGGNHTIDLNNMPQQKPKRKKHRPKVITEGKSRPQKITEKPDSSNETPRIKKKHANVPNTATPCFTSGTSVGQAINHKMQEPSDSKETGTCKRKYVGRSKVPTTSMLEENEASVDAWTIGSGNMEENQGGLRKNPRRRARSKMSTPTTALVEVAVNQEMAGDARKTCRRALNFDMEGQQNNESLRYSRMHGVDSQPKEAICAEEDQMTSVHIGFQIDLAARKRSGTSAPNMMNGDESSVQREAPSASASLKTSTLCLETVEVNSSDEHTQGSHQVVASNLREITSQMMSEISIQSSQVRADDSRSNFIRSIIEKAKELKRKISPSFEQADIQSLNEVAISSNNQLTYHDLIQYQSTYKRKRTQRGQNSSSPGAFLLNDLKAVQQQTAFRRSSEASTSMVNHQIPTSYYETDRLLWATKDAGAAFYPNLATSSYAPSMSKILKRPRSRNASKRQNLHQGYLMSGVLADCKVQQHEPCTKIVSLLSNSPATWKKKKRTKKRVDVVPTSTSNEENQQGKVTLFNRNRFAANTQGAPTQQMWEAMISIDELINQIKRLDINRENSGLDFRKVSAAYDIHHINGQELVLYTRAGSIVPFEPIKTRRPRPKVELDEETNKVWKLLMESINKEGIDGTDEEKAKWWEEERSVFHGRANSFIARMHLVQGDRRFSPWKGSVVDSVVGVFLTQNVSDHLSSSAFMSMAARFAIKSDKFQDSYEETTSFGTGDPIECILDPDSTRLSKDMLNEQSHETSSLALHVTELDDESEPAKSDVSLASSISSYSSKIVSYLCCHAVIDGFNTEIVESRKHDNAEVLDDSQSSQASTASHKQEFNFVSTDGSKLNFQDNCSFAELLQLADSGRAFNIQGNGILAAGNSIMVNGAESQTDISSNQDGKSTESNSRFAPESVRQMTKLEKPALVGEKAQKYPDMDDKLLHTAKGDENLGVHLRSNVPKDFKNDCASPPKEQRNDLQHSQSEALDSNDNNSGSDILDSNLMNTTESHLIGHDPSVAEQMKINEAKRKGKSRRVGYDIQDNFDWESLRKQVEPSGKKRERSANTMDSLDWEAVRCADVEEIAETIKDRGMNNVLAGRIKDFLNRLVREHGSIDLEWLRDIPPDKAKEYLLSIRGLGLKSVECVRLLTLHQLAFPVDTNVGRIAVRLGWVPLQPLPESLQLHLLEMYPVLESIQKYLWPRLCKLDQKTLYELHYQMITFGKVFCTKNKPNCNACPMRGECRHFASAFASARLALPGPEQAAIVSSTENRSADGNPDPAEDRLLLPPTQSSEQLEMELSKVNLQAKAGVHECVPIVEEPLSPEPECSQIMENDIEDLMSEDPDEIPTIKLNIEEFTQNLQNYMQQNMELQEGDLSKALVALTAEAASIPTPKLKNASRLRTEHHVYELPDSHPLLQQMERREPDDPCSYLLAIWTPGEAADSTEPPESRCSSQEHGALCYEETCFSCNSAREANSQIVRGTLLIPCRTAMRGSFPLNGTYFQVNEVFADHDSSLNPIHVPRELIWNLPRRTVYFGTSIPSIFKGLTTEGIQHCFWRGFVCVRGFDQKSRAPRPLMARLHFIASKSTRGKKPEENVDRTKGKTTHQG